MLDITPLPDDLVEVAFRELGETPEKRESGMSELRNKLESGKVTLHRIDDAYLLMFLRWAKFGR
jgi:hypothetical protein